MESHGEIEIIDGSGWIKRQALSKTITLIGSDLGCDITLDVNRGTGVAPRHAQLIHLQDADYGYRLVNLGNTDIVIGAVEGSSLAPRAAVDIANGEVFKLGDFTLILRLGEGVSQHMPTSSQNIGLELVLPATPLAPDRELGGAIVLRNLGERSNVQFEIDLEGLPEDCYQIEPAPVLFPGAEERVRMQIHHRGNQPLAGIHNIEILVSAFDSYPGEEATVSRTIEVLPCYRHQVRIENLEEIKRAQAEEHKQAAVKSPAPQIQGEFVPAEPEPPPEPEEKQAPAEPRTSWWNRLFAPRKTREPAAEEPTVVAAASEAIPDQPAWEGPPEATLPTAAVEAASVDEVAEAILVVQPPEEVEEEVSPDVELVVRGSAQDIEVQPASSGTVPWVAPEAEFGPPPAPELEVPVAQDGRRPAAERPKTLPAEKTRVEAAPEAIVQEKIARQKPSPPAKTAPAETTPAERPARPAAPASKQEAEEWWGEEDRSREEESWWEADAETASSPTEESPAGPAADESPVAGRRVRVLRAKADVEAEEAQPAASVPAQRDAWWTGEDEGEASTDGEEGDVTAQ